MGRTQQILATLALSVVVHAAHASEAPSQETLTTSRGPRVIWAAPGMAPARPQPRLPVEQPTVPLRFRVANVRLLVGLERASSVAVYRSTASGEQGTDVVTRGVEASIIGEVHQEAATPLVMPRLGVDARWTNGFSLGLVLSYAARSAEQTPDVQGTLTANESALLGPRIGWFKPLSSHAALWLRGGPTWARRAQSEPTSEPGRHRTLVHRQWVMSLEPQLVVMPWPHVGLSLGAAFDLGGDGENEVTAGGGSQPSRSRITETVSTYGITAGLLALF